jgi:hypothetical protein
MGDGADRAVILMWPRLDSIHCSRDSACHWQHSCPPAWASAVSPLIDLRNHPHDHQQHFASHVVIVTQHSHLQASRDHHTPRAPRAPAGTSNHWLTCCAAPGHSYCGWLNSLAAMHACLEFARVETHAHADRHQYPHTQTTRARSSAIGSHGPQQPRLGLSRQSPSAIQEETCMRCQRASSTQSCSTRHKPLSQCISRSRMVRTSIHMNCFASMPPSSRPATPVLVLWAVYRLRPLRCRWMMTLCAHSDRLSARVKMLGTSRKSWQKRQKASQDMRPRPA